MRSTLAILLAFALLAALPPAGRSTGPAPAREPWATVNLCDTMAHPNQIGIRAGMPGLARRTRMYMRFRVQFKTLDERWRTIESPHADSRWRRVATGRRGQYDAGWTFAFKPPAAGGAHILRGMVSFEWRRAHRVVRRDRVYTDDGHPETAGADPPDFSAAMCEIA